MGFEDLVGGQQRRAPQQRQPDADRSRRPANPAAPIPVDDPYNLYFTPDGRAAIVVAERHKRLDFRDPQTMALQQSIATPNCSGINHADFSIDGRYAIFTCEFRGGGLVKIDLVNRQVLGYLQASRSGACPRTSASRPTARAFYVADMHADGVYVVDGDSFTQTDFIPTGDRHARALPEPRRQGTVCRQSRLALDARRAARQGQHRGRRLRDRQGRADLADPGRRQPRHGQCQRGRKAALAVRAVRQRRLRHRHSETGAVKSIPVGQEPHGLTVWPQPGRYSLGHTGNMR